MQMKATLSQLHKKDCKNQLALFAASGTIEGAGRTPWYPNPATTTIIIQITALLLSFTNIYYYILEFFIELIDRRTNGTRTQVR